MTRHGARGPLIAIVTVAAIMAIVPSVDGRQQSRMLRFCGRYPVAELFGPGRPTPRLPFRDEGATRPDFLAFRESLMRAIARKDREAVLRVAHPDISISFDGGIAALKNLIESPEQDFWGEFGRVLSMGGTFVADGFAAPYVYSTWPDEFDSYGCSAITASAVRLRDRPDSGGAILAQLDFDIVEELHDGPDTPGWTRVRTVTGITGFVASQFVRSPIAYRAGFVLDNGAWRLKWYAAGD